MDSDCDVAHDAVEKAVQIFLSDPTIGAMTGHARLRGAQSSSSQDPGCMVCRWPNQLLKGMEIS